MLLFQRGFMFHYLGLHSTVIMDTAIAIVQPLQSIWSAGPADLMVRSMDGVVHLALLLFLFIDGQ